jgi:hypothetical protein
LLRSLRASLVLVALLLIPSWASTAHAATPPAGMFSVGDWAWPSSAALDREAAAGISSWRVTLDYGAIGSSPSALQFGGVDALVASMATRGITPVVVLTGCPTWACPAGGPANTEPALGGWLAFVAAVAHRYGPGGTFWAGHPSVPALPVTAWQVGNEVNGSDQWPNPDPAAYAAFLASTSQALRGASPSARVVLAGLPEKMTIWLKDYLPALYAQPGFKESFDIVAVHGYAASAADVPPILDLARVIMAENGDDAKPIWITEMGWATAGPASPFVVGEGAQADYLRSTWDTLLACRARWNLQRVYWYGWQDKDPGPTADYWGYHVGLNRVDGTPKAALSVVDEFTRGAALPDGRADGCGLAGGTTTITDPRLAKRRPRGRGRPKGSPQPTSRTQAQATSVRARRAAERKRARARRAAKRR